MKKALVLMICLCMLASMMTGITVGAAWDLMYYPVETESVVATSWKTAIDNAKYNAEDGTQKTIDLNGVADATLRYITPGANGTAGAIELAMVPNETVADKKSDGTNTTRGTDYRPRILTNHRITLRTGNTYKISVYVKGNLSGTNEVNLWLDSDDKVTFDTDSSTPSAYRDVFRVRVTDQWQYVEKEFKVKEITDRSGNVKDSSSLTLGMRPLTNFPSGSFQVDELKVELTNKVASATNTIFTNGIGDGSVIDPYEITTVSDILKFTELIHNNEYLRTSHFKLMNDLDFTGVTNFKGISGGMVKDDGTLGYYYNDTRRSFKGTFDGQGHVIKNLFIPEKPEASGGFFRVIEGAIIKNLGFENADISGYRSVGILTGLDMGGSTIENCFARNSKTLSSHRWSGGYIGALVGEMNATDCPTSTYNNCYTTNVSVSIRISNTEGEYGTSSSIGGIVGATMGSSISNVVLNNCYTDMGKLASNESDANTGLTKNNCYASVTAGSLKASDLNSDVFMDNKKTGYNSGMPVFKWEADRLPEVEEPATYTVSVTVGANGSVTKDGAAVPASFEVEENETVTLTLVPDAKYIAKAKVNDADYTVTNNQVTLTITEDTAIEVIFERIPDVTPGFAGDGSSYTWFKTVDGKATIFSYHKLSAFNTGETDLGYGIKLWKTADPENKVILPAYDPATNQPAKAVPGAMFAIRVYGDAITADQSYTILPFVGTVTGSETAPDFE